MIDVRLLGAVTADRDGESVSLGGRGPTTLLALLALNPGEVVAIDRIIDAVWEGDPPATAVNQYTSTSAPTARPIPVPRCMSDSTDVSCGR